MLNFICLCFPSLIFWAQGGSAPRIERASLDGRDRRVLVSYSIRDPVALSLGMTWYIWNVHQYLVLDSQMYANVFPLLSILQMLQTTLCFHATLFCLDMPRELLYWVDRGMKSISRVDTEGRHRKTVVESNGYLDRPFGLAVFEVKRCGQWFMTN